ncbi:hypothetical protein AK812_SmicGene43916 [Symbiodinium microadriaticum]|uniref:Uncharacterized protein n=1 Tax=Symbiodinium microadriaticum TaxID=2951 RepID=A0A1Q9BZT4_SYMMI|nr:hypothetical protein AK812_SmicGene43916 [Symbiodinium microadriaticum]
MRFSAAAMLEFFTREIFIERTRGSTLPEANNVSSAAQVPCHNPSKQWLWLRWLRKRAPPSRALRSQDSRERRKNGWWRAAQTESEHLEAATSALQMHKRPGGCSNFQERAPPTARVAGNSRPNAAGDALEA